MDLLATNGGLSSLYLPTLDLLLLLGLAVLFEVHLQACMLFTASSAERLCCLVLSQGQDHKTLLRWDCEVRPHQVCPDCLACLVAVTSAL